MRRGCCRAVTVALVALLAAGCRGPRPEVESFAMRAGEPGTLVDVVVVNRNEGEGDVEVEVTLRSEGKVVSRETRTVPLYPHERVTVVVPVPVPYRRDLAADVKASYPVD
jgi:hypothetical protein